MATSPPCPPARGARRRRRRELAAAGLVAVALAGCLGHPAPAPASQAARPPPATQAPVPSRADPSTTTAPTKPSATQPAPRRSTTTIPVPTLPATTRPPAPAPQALVAGFLATTRPGETGPYLATYEVAVDAAGGRVETFEEQALQGAGQEFAYWQGELGTGARPYRQGYWSLATGTYACHTTTSLDRWTCSAAGAPEPDAASAVARGDPPAEFAIEASNLAYALDRPGAFSFSTVSHGEGRLRCLTLRRDGTLAARICVDRIGLVAVLQVPEAVAALGLPAGSVVLTRLATHLGHAPLRLPGRLAAASGG